MLNDGRTQILKSEARVKNVTQVLGNEYINPIDEKIDQNKLIHLSSGIHVDEKAAIILHQSLYVHILGIQILLKYVLMGVKSYDKSYYEKCFNHF